VEWKKREIVNKETFAHAYTFLAVILAVVFHKKSVPSTEMTTTSNHALTFLSSAVVKINIKCCTTVTPWHNTASVTYKQHDMEKITALLHKLFIFQHPSPMW
jgi:hypothetical protein